MDHITRRTVLKRTGMTVAGLALSSGKMLGAQGQPNGQALKVYPASRVPKYRFADTLEAQEAQLKDNPLLKHFRDVRKRQDSRDRYRPLYHFISPSGTMNDPNGLCFWQGRWHLFYQAWPGEDPRQHWAHAVSDDLIHWRDLPYALYPGPENACFSGNAIVEKDRVVAMYLGHRYGEMVATSGDPLLLNWEKLTGKAVIPDEKSTGTGDREVFDPGIWKKDGMYYALTQRAWADMKGQLLRSKDLKTWTRLHTFVENDRYSVDGDDLSCPYFLPIGDRYIMLFFSHARGGRYFLGDYDKKRDKFVVTGHDDFNFGAVTPGGVHAPSAFPDGKGGVIVLFNMNPGIGTGAGGQIMTLPRRLTLLSHKEVGVEPAGAFESLRYGHQHVSTMTLAPNKEVVLEHIKGNAMEISAEIAAASEMTGNGLASPVFEMNVLRSPQKQEYTRIAFYRARGRNGTFSRKRARALITIDSTHSSTHADALLRAPETAPVMMGKDEALKLRVFVDRSSVEVFVNGRQCAAVRVYPEREDSVGVSLRSQGRASKLTRLDAWQMKSIYE